MTSIPDKSPEQLESTGQLQAYKEIVDLAFADAFGEYAFDEARLVVASPPADAAAEWAEHTDFDVILLGFDKVSKIRVLKAVREATGLGLGEAKALVETAPKAVIEGVSRADAEVVKEQLEQAGANVYISGNGEELSAKHNSQQDDDSMINRLDNIFNELARVDHRILQSQVGIDDLKTETRELLNTLRVSIF
jgi:large subunit ribosomal protein L7/L12